MFRFALCAYVVLSLTLAATSLYTGHRAKAISGKDYYLFTRTHILVEKNVEPTNEGDAAFDAALEEAGESAAIPVEEPVFVLGFLDATAPLVLGGGVMLLAARFIARRRRQPRAPAPACEGPGDPRV